MKRIATIILLVLGTLNSQSKSNFKGKLLPSEGLALTYDAMNSNMDGKRMEVIGHILPRVVKENLSGDELFYLGDLYFWNFKPKESEDAFKPFLKEKGLRARSAWQRSLQIKFRAYDKHDEVEKLIREYRKQFPAIPEDRYGMFGQVWNVASRYEKLGDYKKVLQLISEELKSLNYSGAYRSFNLPAYFNKSYRELGKVDEAIKLLEIAMNNLSKTLKNRKNNIPKNDPLYVVHSNRVERMLTPYQSKKSYTQINQKFEELINALNESIKKYKSNM